MLICPLLFLCRCSLPVITQNHNMNAFVALLSTGQFTSLSFSLPFVLLHLVLLFHVFLRLLQLLRLRLLALHVLCVTTGLLTCSVHRLSVDFYNSIIMPPLHVLSLMADENGMTSLTLSHPGDMQHIPCSTKYCINYDADHNSSHLMPHQSY